MWEDKNFPGAFCDLKIIIKRNPVCFENSIKRNVVLQERRIKEESEGLSKVNQKKKYYLGLTLGNRAGS